MNANNTHPYNTYALNIQIISHIATITIMMRPTSECAGSFSFSAMPNNNRAKN